MDLVRPKNDNGMLGAPKSFILAVAGQVLESHLPLSLTPTQSCPSLCPLLPASAPLSSAFLLFSLGSAVSNREPLFDSNASSSGLLPTGMQACTCTVG